MTVPAQLSLPVPAHAGTPPSRSEGHTGAYVRPWTRRSGHKAAERTFSQRFPGYERVFVRADGSRGVIPF